MVNENCIRLKKSDGGNFCIKIGTRNQNSKWLFGYLKIQNFGHGKSKSQI